MQKLYIKPTKATPEIDFSPRENRFIIRGNSSPEDVRALYYPVTEWIKLFIDDVLEGEFPEFTEANPIKLIISLSYFNSSSAKFLYDILAELKRLLPGKLIKVDWQYEEGDNDMKDAGADMSTLAGIDFSYTLVSRTG